MVTRRKLISAGGAGGLSIIAGCTVIESLYASSPQLGEVYIENQHTTPGEIHIVVTHEGEQIHTSIHHLDDADDSGRHLEIQGEYLDHRVWEDLDGEFRIKASLDGGDDWVATDLSNFDDDVCVSYIVRRIDVDTINFLSTPNCEPVGNNPYADDSST